MVIELKIILMFCVLCKFSKNFANKNQSYILINQSLFLIKINHIFYQSYIDIKYIIYIINILFNKNHHILQFKKWLISLCEHM